MTALIYAITDDGQSALPQLCGTAVRTVSDGELVAFVGDHAARRTLDGLLAHEQVVDALMEHHTILPMRFGAWVDGDEEILSLLRERRPRWSSALDRVRGAHEFGIRTEWRDPADAAPERTAQSGTAYMLARLDLRRRATAAARGLESLATHARDSRISVLPRPTIPCTAAYLIDSERRDAFLEACADIDAVLDDVDVVCTGPWPPYSFVEDDET